MSVAIYYQVKHGRTFIHMLIKRSKVNERFTSYSTAYMLFGPLEVDETHEIYQQ